MTVLVQDPKFQITSYYQDTFIVVSYLIKNVDLECRHKLGTLEDETHGPSAVISVCSIFASHHSSDVRCQSFC